MNIFTKRIFELAPQTFGLDLSDLSLKIIQLERRGKFLRLRSFLDKKIPEGLVVKGEIKNIKKVSKLIQEALREAKEPIKTKYVNLSLPEEKVFTKVIQMPKMKPEELSQAVKWEAEANIPLKREKVYLGWEVIGASSSERTSDHLDVFLAACSKELVDSYLKTLKDAGLQAITMEPESMSIVRALVKPTEAKEARLIVDLGATRAEVVIFSNQALRFTQNISISSGDFTRVIAKQLKLEESEAEKVKIKYGLDKTKMEGRVFDALTPILSDLSEQIQKSITFYQEHATHESTKDGLIHKILLCGGGARLKGLVSFLTIALKKKVEIANPWSNIVTLSSRKARELPPISKNESLVYTTAIGLALR